MQVRARASHAQLPARSWLSGYNILYLQRCHSLSRSLLWEQGAHADQSRTTSKERVAGECALPAAYSQRRAFGMVDSREDAKVSLLDKFRIRHQQRQRQSEKEKDENRICAPSRSHPASFASAHILHAVVWNCHVSSEGARTNAHGEQRHKVRHETGHRRYCFLMQGMRSSQSLLPARIT